MTHCSVERAFLDKKEPPAFLPGDFISKPLVLSWFSRLDRTLPRDRTYLV